jgi:geranylgeranyl pyrophosphate synthase
MAILAGDFLLARASLALSRLRNVQVHSPLPKTHLGCRTLIYSDSQLGRG